MARHIANASGRRPLQPALREALARQNPERDDGALASPNLGVVVTGQQVGLFLGPAYSIYKAITALALADRLTQQGQPTVAVFWLQSEDHDHDEVAAATVLDEADERQTVRAGATGEPRAAMAQRALGDDVTEALDALDRHLGGQPHRDATLAMLRRHYRPGAGWVEAFGDAMRELLGPHGLWVLDPRRDALGAASAPVIRRAIVEHEAIEAATLRGADAVDEVGVAPRPGCALCFFHPDGPRGPRYRPTREGDGWTWPGASAPVTTADLVARLEEDALAFSTSSLLRLMLQESWLPTVAHVVGPGEARYVRQAPPLHAHFGLTSPAVVLRGRFVITERTDRRKLEALGVEAPDLAAPDPLLHRLAEGDPGLDGEALQERLRDAFRGALDPLVDELIALDPDLERAVSRTLRHVDKGLRGFGRRVDRARARRDDVRTARVQALASRLFPGGSPQERVLTFPHFAARYSWSVWVDAVREAVETHLDALERGAEPQLRTVAL